MLSESPPRFYDVFEPHRDYTMRPRKQQLDHTQDELLGDRSSSGSETVSPDSDSLESDSTRQKLEVSRELRTNSVLYAVL